MDHIAYIVENEVFGSWDAAKAFCEENEVKITDIKIKTAQAHGEPSFVVRRKGEQVEPGTYVHSDYVEAVRESLEMTDGETVIWMGEINPTGDGRVTA